MKPPGDIPPDSECLAALGSIDLAFKAWKGVVSSRSEASTLSSFAEHSLWIDQYTIAGGASRASLRFSEVDGVDVVREWTTSLGIVRQVRTNTQLIDVVDLATGFEIRYYTSLAKLPKVNGLFPLPAANYDHAWRVENLGPDPQGNQRLQVSQIIPIRTSPGPVTVFALYSMDPSGELTLTKDGATAEKKKELAVDPDQPQAVPDPDNRDHWIIRGTYDGAGLLMAQHVEHSRLTVLQDGSERLLLLEVRDGLGAERQTTYYNYDPVGVYLWKSQYAADGATLIGYEASDGNGGTFRPYGDGPGGPDALAYFNSIASFSSNGTTQQSVLGHLVSLSTDTVTADTAVVPDPAHPQNPLTVNLAITQTDRQTGADGSVLTSIVWKFADDAPAPYAGQVYQQQEEDGRRHRYLYEPGTWDGAAFSPWTGTGSLRTTVIEGNPFPIANQTTKAVSILDASANLVAEESYVCTGGGDYPAAAFTLLTRTLHTYDDQNHLLTSVKDGRTTYTAGWQDGQKQWEKDDTGVKTSFANYDSAGRPGLVVREALPADGNLSAIPALTTVYEYDALGRRVHQQESDGASSMDRRWSYDSLGRLLSESLNGVATTYAYAASGRQVTKTMPGGWTEITETLLDGSTSHIYGTGVLERRFTHTHP